MPCGATFVSSVNFGSPESMPYNLITARRRVWLTNPFIAAGSERDPPPSGERAMASLPAPLNQFSLPTLLTAWECVAGCRRRKLRQNKARSGHTKPAAASLAGQHAAPASRGSGPPAGGIGKKTRRARGSRREVNYLVFVAYIHRRRTAPKHLRVARSPQYPMRRRPSSRHGPNRQYKSAARCPYR